MSAPTPHPFRDRTTPLPLCGSIEPRVLSVSRFPIFAFHFAGERP